MMIPNIRAALWLIVTGALMVAGVLAWAVWAYAAAAPTECVTPDGWSYTTSYDECPPPAGALLEPHTAIPPIHAPPALLTLPETS